MSASRIFGVVGLLLVFVGLAMLLAAGVSMIYRDGDTGALLVSAGFTSGVGFLGYRLATLKGDITVREGYAIVTVAWAGTALFGALPYMLAGVVESPIHGLFESMSGFTTTGATIMTDIEALPHGILFWRSFTHWLGGMGIIVLAIAVLPYLGVGGMQLFRAEVPGPTPERLRPRITQTAKLLWFVYLGLTVLQTTLYVLAGLDWFDAVTHTFGTLATGGFSTRNASIGAFPAPAVQYVTIVFMYLAGVNFALHFRAATGRLDYFRDQEWRFFTGVVLTAAAVLTVVNLGSGGFTGVADVEPAFRDALFQATAITTTTGYATADYELWAPLGQMILFGLMFVGGMSGSTGGGVKAMRVLLLFKQTAMELRKQLHPRAILLARLGRKVVKEDVMANVVGFVVLYVLLFGAGAIALAGLGADFLTALGASAATVGNIGPGFGAVGPTDTYAWMSEPALVLLSFLMLVGRLEIYTVLLLFLPDTWRRRGRRVTG